MPLATDNLSSVLPHARYLARLCAAQPALAKETEATWSQALDSSALQAWLTVPNPGEDGLKQALRHFKQHAYARVVSRDISGQSDLNEVMESMTLIAEMAVQTAVSVLTTNLISRHGTPRNSAGEVQEFIVIGMGKLGGRELNVSSDIDLIFVYPEDGDTDAVGENTRSISNFEFFTRLGRQLINAIADITEDGQVFRVDMRLRPNGDSGPLVSSFDMLENYFVTQGREWERYAWIKARPLTGNRHAELEAIRRPFVFRKYLDFGTINAMRGLHAQIRREVTRKDMADNIKLGPGGIREIEFIAQVFQLIRGGRDTALQIKPTCSVLALLADRGLVAEDTVRDLTSAYVFLRRLEHRLQILDDLQTHSLPATVEDQALIATSMSYTTYDELLAALNAHREVVTQQFGAVFDNPQNSEQPLTGVWACSDKKVDDGKSCTDYLTKLGYRDATTATQHLLALRNGFRYQQLSADGRARLDMLVPHIVVLAAKETAPDGTLNRALDLLDVIARRSAYLALLEQYPQALARVVQLIGSASWAAQYLREHPVLLDELIAPRLLEAPPDWPKFRATLSAQLDSAEPDTERQMDILREAHHAQVFRLLTQDLAGLLPLEKLSDHLSELADILLEATLQRVWQKLSSRHRETPRFAIIAYGKLGGKELGYGSDLDLVFLFDDDAPNAAESYSRLATRLNTWLSAHTSAGQLFDTDLRLRPNGDSGLIVSSLEAFRKYQAESAWMWEHQALTRARFAAGDKELGQAFETTRIEVLRTQRDTDKLRTEVLAMRQKMRDALSSKEKDAEVFDLKHDAGGLVDVEFIVQYLILGHAHAHAELTGNLGNIALLKIAADLALIPNDMAEAVRNAYREYRRRQHTLRLNGARPKVPVAELAEHAKAVRALWHYVFATD